MKELTQWMLEEYLAGKLENLPPEVVAHFDAQRMAKGAEEVKAPKPSFEPTAWKHDGEA